MPKEKAKDLFKSRSKTVQKMLFHTKQTLLTNHKTYVNKFKIKTQQHLKLLLWNENQFGFCASFFYLKKKREWQ